MTIACRDEVLAILRKHVGSAEVSDETRLYHDLWISGDDAFELLSDLNRAFGTSFKNMDFHKYFPAENEGTGYRLLRHFGFRSKYKPLSFCHLLSVVDDGVWRDS